MCHRSSSAVDLTLIKCTTHKLKQKNSTESFIALSYVWGPSPQENGAESQSTESKPSNLPLSIRDEVQVYKEMCINYLWVDIYCISRDPEESHKQISSMDAVYQEAVLTIVAARGESPSSGLVGVSKLDRIRQPSVKIGDWVLVPCLLSPQDIVSKSKWNTRGWTYQEGMLSSRKL